MDKRDAAELFRSRLSQALDRRRISRAELCRRVGIDRSTLAQLMASDTHRLPRADTVAALAGGLQVSADWLLGLTTEPARGADILEQSVQIEVTLPSPADARLAAWHREAAGYKIRYVPTTLPDLVKTDAVLAHEYHDFAAVSTEQAITIATERPAYTRQPESDIEVCSPLQDLEVFARGGGLWQGLAAANRRAQLEQIVALLDELYPAFRWFLYDARRTYSVPMTIFGPQRAAVYMGNLYFVYNTTEHIRVLTRHFDGLIRAAIVQPPDTRGWIRSLIDQVGEP